MEKVKFLDMINKMIIKDYISELKGTKVKIISLFNPAYPLGHGLRTYVMVEENTKWLEYIGEIPKN
jgi:hypothetical protein